MQETKQEEGKLAANSKKHQGEIQASVTTDVASMEAATDFDSREVACRGFWRRQSLIDRRRSPSVPVINSMMGAVTLERWHSHEDRGGKPMDEQTQVQTDKQTKEPLNLKWQELEMESILHFLAPLQDPKKLYNGLQWSYTPFGSCSRSYWEQFTVECLAQGHDNRLGSNGIRTTNLSVIGNPLTQHSAASRGRDAPV